MVRQRKIGRNSSSKLERIASDVAMAVWNVIAKLPQFQYLAPKDYPPVYEAVLRAMKEASR